MDADEKRHIHIPIQALKWDPMGDVEDGTALLSTILIGGVYFHVNAFLVEEVDGVQQAKVDCDAELYQDMLSVYEQAMMTVKLPGRPGNWMIVIHPYGR